MGSKRTERVENGTPFLSSFLPPFLPPYSLLISGCHLTIIHMFRMNCGHKHSLLTLLYSPSTLADSFSISPPSSLHIFCAVLCVGSHSCCDGPATSRSQVVIALIAIFCLSEGDKIYLFLISTPTPRFYVISKQSFCFFFNFLFQLTSPICLSILLPLYQNLRSVFRYQQLDCSPLKSLSPLPTPFSWGLISSNIACFLNLFIYIYLKIKS